MDYIQIRIRVSHLKDLTSFYEDVLKAAGIKIVTKNKVNPAKTIEKGEDEGVKLGGVDSERLGLLEATYIDLDEKTRSGALNVSRDMHISIVACIRNTLYEFEKITAAAGAKVLVPVSHISERGRFAHHVIIQDPDGRTIELRTYSS